ncbi:MAG: hypothetical protein J7L62_05500 [Candidatus Aminicenantes bacterium]|nr:hypothetical protein [Candidatus Aminicenantes bacterium]
MKKLRAFGIVGIFWGLFGTIVALSSLIVEDKVSKIINFSAGFTLIVMALLFFYLDRKQIK